jgi:hypothetical protein
MDEQKTQRRFNITDENFKYILDLKYKHNISISDALNLILWFLRMHEDIIKIDYESISRGW